jgi:hypothetical protein
MLVECISDFGDERTVEGLLENLADLSEKESEAVTKQLASLIRSILQNHIVQLDAKHSALQAEAHHLHEEIAALRQQKEEIERRLAEEGRGGPAHG